MKSRLWNEEVELLHQKHGWGAPRILVAISRNEELQKKTGEDPPSEKWVSNSLANIRGRKAGSPERGLKESELSRRPQRTGDAVYQQAWLKHVSKLTGISEVLRGQLDLPLPHDAGSWMPPQGRMYGVLAIYTGRSRSISGPGYLWDPQAPTSGFQFRLCVECDIYFPSLQFHIPDANLWSQFRIWKDRVHGYLLNCRQFLQEIIADCESKAGSKLLISEEWPQEGIFWHFAQRIYLRYSYLAQGISLPNSKYERGQAPSRLPAQRMIYTLSDGGAPIACHHDQNSRAVWQGVHEKLLSEDRQEWKAKAEALLKEQKKLMKFVKPIQQALRFEIERGTFDRGSCKLCP